MIAIQLAPGSAVTEDALWVTQPGGNAVMRIDARNNTPSAPIVTGAAPCASLAAVGDALWVPQCDAGKLSRLSIKGGNVSASMPLPIVTPAGSIAHAVGSIWALTESKGVLSRIDPDINLVVAEAYVAGKPAAVMSGGDALWVTSEDGDLVTRIDPFTNAIVATIKVGPRPGRIVFGEGAVWTLNRGDGSVSRVDAKSNKVTTTIAVSESIAHGDIAVGEGSVWISADGVPITRIDPATNRVVQRFPGTGGGAIVVAHGSVWVSAGPKVTWRLDPKLIAALRPE
ncbi:MAG TPA: hypothetical protein VNJ02_11025 [Vicinamibacterales bacterium]|nr:hypothetical protein [Vicinamibacterales bacterium]